MKNQALFSSKDKSKKIKCRLLQFLFCTLRVKRTPWQFMRQRAISAHIFTVYPFVSLFTEAENVIESFMFCL